MLDLVVLVTNRYVGLILDRLMISGKGGAEFI